MKRGKLLVVASLVLGLALVARPPHANEAPAPKGAGLLARTDQGVVAFTLERTSVEVDVAGVMSRVRVKQTFKNPFSTPIEAVYVFPLPAHAAVHAMTMRVGERRITANVKKRVEARHEYQAAREAGKTAALLEEERDDVFTQSVANILPNDAIEVELAYTQELVPVDGEYELVYPMVVAPRYNPASVKDADRITPPTMPSDTRSGADITMHVWIEAGVPIDLLRSPSHDVMIKNPRPGTAMIDLSPVDRIPNRDFSLRWRLGSARPRAAVIAGKDVHGGHLLLMLQPQVDLRSPDAAPREYVFVLDVSGSMNGQPHERSKLAMEMLLHDLRPTDRINVILFESGVQYLWAGSQLATRPNIRQALAFVDSTVSEGGTEVLPALRAAVESPRQPGMAREIAIMTDGEIGNEEEILTYLRAHRRGLNVFSVGVGSSVNRGFIDALGRVGHGEAFVMLPNDDAEKITKKLFRLMSRPSLTDVQIDWGGLPVHDVVPAQAPDLFADRPIVLAAKFDRAASGTVTLRGKLAGQPYEEKIAVDLPAAEGSDALAYLWARRRITELSDEHPVDERATKKIEAAITDLGLSYHLVTPFTSFVAVDERVRTSPGKPLRVDQPVPLPPDVAPVEYASPRARLSSYSVRGGDPEVEITAARDVRGISVILPDGIVKRCSFDRARAVWLASFLLPTDMAPGIHLVSVVLERGDGTVQLRRLRLQVDETAPQLAVALDRDRVGPGTPVRLSARSTGPMPTLAPLDDDIGERDFAARVLTDADEVFAIVPSPSDDHHGTMMRLVPDRSAPRAFETTFLAPILPGRYRIAVLARDGARNGARTVVELEVVAR